MGLEHLRVRFDRLWYSISPISIFPLFILSRALKTTSSQSFVVDGSSVTMGLRVMMVKSAWKCRRSGGDLPRSEDCLYLWSQLPLFRSIVVPGRFGPRIWRLNQAHRGTSRAPTSERCLAYPVYCLSPDLKRSFEVWLRGPTWVRTPESK